MKPIPPLKFNLLSSSRPPPPPALCCALGDLSFPPIIRRRSARAKHTTRTIISSRLLDRPSYVPFSREGTCTSHRREVVYPLLMTMKFVPPPLTAIVINVKMNLSRRLNAINVAPSLMSPANLPSPPPSFFNYHGGDIIFLESWTPAEIFTVMTIHTAGADPFRKYLYSSGLEDRGDKLISALCLPASL